MHSLYAISHCSAVFLPSPPRGGPRVGVRTFGLDYPDTDDVRWRVVTRLQLDANNAIELYADPVKESAASGLHR